MSRLFTNREEAAYFLAGTLRKRFLDRPTVLTFARATIPMARILASRLRCDFDFVPNSIRAAERALPGRIEDRDIILLYDGIAYADPILEALREMRARRLKQTIVTTPIVSRQALERLRSEEVDVVALDFVRNFNEVEDFYAENPELSDEEVAQLLRKTNGINPARQARV